jgi:carbon-monoxide dehydrogenase medium subunit
MTTALETGEILREIRLSKSSGRTGQSYAKMHHPASGFAVVGVAANLSLTAEGKCEQASIGITGVAAKAYRPAEVESALNGKVLNADTIASAAAHATNGIEANGDLFASADYRKHLAEVYTRRALTEANAGAR